MVKSRVPNKVILNRRTFYVRYERETNGSLPGNALIKKR